MVKKTIIIYFILLNFSNVLGGEITGLAKIIDGDTIHVNSLKIRLEGIDAPEIRQTCRKPYIKISSIIGFTISKDYSCGLISKKKLSDKINNHEIKCQTLSKDKYKRFLATCFKKKLNLNKWMVRNGYAVAYKRYSKQYLEDETYAKKNKKGIWQGKFVRPEKWRKLN